MQKNRTLLIVMSIIMVCVTAISYVGGVYALSRHMLPLGMAYVDRANPTEVGVILIVLAVLLTIADIGLVAWITRGKWRSLGNIASFAAWVCALLVFIWGTTSVGAEWLVFFLLTLPPLISWIYTGPSIEVAGESW